MCYMNVETTTIVGSEEGRSTWTLRPRNLLKK
jgi:hypothetical protein